jgi:hypothetical protein
MKLALHAADGDNKPDHQGEREISRNAIVQGMPDVSANLW